MVGVALPFHDWLHAAGDPSDNGLYFLGTFDRRITFYSQQVRALRLVHALNRLGTLKSNDHIAVVGAGAAGVTAAFGLALLGNDVTLYDPAESILQLQSASPRLLHPHIYEWPELGSLTDHAGLPVLDWSANFGGKVCSELQAEFAAARTRLKNLTFKSGHCLTSLERAGVRWRLGITSEGTLTHREYTHVVVAIGFGDEISCGDAKPVHYWKQNSTGSTAAEPHSPANYIVSGNGDGGLTDLLNLLIIDFDHVGFTRRFLDYFSDDTLRIKTQLVWNSVCDGDDLAPLLTTHLLPLLRDWSVIDRIGKTVRADRIIQINSVGPLFAAGKAAQLNQVMAFAVLEAAKEAGRPVQESSGHVVDVSQSGVGFEVSIRNAVGLSSARIVDHVILRHGPNRDLRYLATGAFFQSYKKYISAFLAARPDLRMPPVLHPETYNFFEALRIAKVESPTSQLISQKNSASVSSTLIIALDAASHVLVELGSVPLLEIADKCERLTNKIVIHLAVIPSKLPRAADIVRLALASGGQITLVAESSGISEWKGLVPNIGEAPPAMTYHPPVGLDIRGIRAAIDACLLRLLDKRIAASLSSNRSEGLLCSLDQSVVIAIGPTWAAWHATLAANKKLLGAFLRWLSNVEHDNDSMWSGDHAQIPHLEAALIMMLATHHGEPLQPALLDRGNLAFSRGAVALGSGCLMVGKQSIAKLDQPDQWGVDALILSGSAEVEVLDPPGRVLDAGVPITAMTAARRVRPVVIRNDKHWRGRLERGLLEWTTAVESEFVALRARQDKELEDLSK